MIMKSNNFKGKVAFVTGQQVTLVELLRLLLHSKALALSPPTFTLTKLILTEGDSA